MPSFLTKIAIGVALLGGPISLRAETPAQAARRTPVVEVFQRTRDAVVNIAATQVFETTAVPFNFDLLDEFFGGSAPRSQTRRYTATSLGSGFVIHSDGYIVTNAHVLVQAAVQKVIFADKSEYEAERVAIDEQHDLAVLRIKAEKPVPAITLGRSDDIMVGESVIAIGNPLGFQHTVTAGIVSAVDRTLQVNQNLSFDGLIQTDASINRGNSGGPLLNVMGELIGINTAIRGDAQNIGFAIPVDALRKLLPDMLSIERGPKRLEIGLRLSWRNRLNVVEAKGPAAAAGIEAGDELLSVDGRPMKHDVDFYVYLLGIKPENHLLLELKRGAKAIHATLQPNAVPIPDGNKLLKQRFGFAVRLLTKQQAQDLDLKGGLVITSVEPGSPADQAGFQSGLIVVQVGQHFPTDLDELGLLLEHVNPGEKVQFRVWRIQRDFIRVYAVQLIAR